MKVFGAKRIVQSGMSNTVKMTKNFSTKLTVDLVSISL
jgi:hypothetical protein